MAEAKAEGAPKPKKKLLLFIVIGVVTLVVLLGGGLLAFLMLGSAPAADEHVAEATQDAKPKAKKADSGHPPVFEKLPIFTVNLISESGEVMQTEIALGLYDATAQAAIKQWLPRIQGEVNKLLSSKTPEEVKTPEGREKLEVEVKDLVNKILDDESVLSVNFISFIVR